MTSAANKLAKGVESQLKIAFKAGAQIMQTRMLASVDSKVDKQVKRRETAVAKKEVLVGKEKAKNLEHRKETMRRKRKVEERNADLNHYAELVVEAGENNQDLRGARGEARAANAGKRKAEEAMDVLAKDCKEVGDMVEMLKEKSKVKTGNVSAVYSSTIGLVLHALCTA
jgi:malate synthase